MTSFSEHMEEMDREEELRLENHFNTKCENSSFRVRDCDIITKNVGKDVCVKCGAVWRY